MLVIMLFQLTASVLADAPVWRVTDGMSVIYLGGTVHLLRPEDFPLPEEFELAYEASSELVFETDISSINDLNIQAQMLQKLTYDIDRSLRDVVDTEAYTALDAYMAEVGMPLIMLERFKPGMIVSTLQMLEFQRMGFAPQGVDVVFNIRALADGKAIGALETIDEQIAFLALMGEGSESEFIIMSLEDLKRTSDSIDKMIDAWRTGDSEVLRTLLIDGMLERAPGLYDSLLRQRNLRWIPQIEFMFDDPETEFVLVGAAHLVGEDGILEYLRAKGYEISKL
ncbi:MAG TPA: TraB/GumN family protein [Gammaproteobacteria bacterium]|nr:TraB/GumN family protein [Gammaproteobacteria bacterium]